MTDAVALGTVGKPCSATWQSALDTASDSRWASHRQPVKRGYTGPYRSHDLRGDRLPLDSDGNVLIPAHVICRKRDGEVLHPQEIEEFVLGYTQGRIPDYQMAALAMAVYFQGMTTEETVALTRSMLHSGVTLRWPSDATCVDKHSTGGIGDKVSLVAAPLLACCGCRVPMLSGRGLGTTGGTLDKLESIPGFRTDLSIEEIVRLTARVGCVITGASAELAPADRQMYHLRDVTGTVPSTPLIVASILSKKLAEGISSLVLDVKVGNGAFAKTIAEGRKLAWTLVEVGTRMGLRMTALLTDMNQPLGQAVGNALEVREAMDTLRGQGPAEVLELAVRLGTELLLVEGQAVDEQAARRAQLQHIQSGKALAKFEEMVAAQGGRLAFRDIDPSDALPAAKDGYVHAIDAGRLGEAVMALGGGRRVMSDRINHEVGIKVLVRVGDRVTAGQPLLEVFGPRTAASLDLHTVIRLEADAIAPRPLVVDRIEYPR